MLQKILGIALLFCSIASGYLLAQVPDRINYQGMLTGTDGEIVEDGLYAIQFNLYGETDTSTPLWSETQNITIVNGVFNVILGTVNSLELPFDEQYYLGIAVGDGAELSPRIALTSAAYSFRAKSIEDGQVVKSINELKDDIQLEAGENVSIAEDQNKIIISAASTGGSGNITQITAGDGLTGGGSEGEVTLAVEDEGITAGKLADGSVTGATIADGAAVRSMNGLTDNVTLTAEGGATITSDGNSIIINAGSGNGTSAWSLTGNAATDPATDFLGTTDDVPLEIRVNGARVMRYEPETAEDGPNVIGGWSGNSVSEGVVGATIAGGGNPDLFDTALPNQVTEIYGTVGGGSSNTASGSQSTVGGGVSNMASSTLATVSGGASNTASRSWTTVGGGASNTAGGAFGSYATVGGGYENTASGSRATIGGGISNTASGSSATVPGGGRNHAGGNYSFAAGRRAKAEHAGAFVWADSDANSFFGVDFASTGLDQFLIRATGGVGINTNEPTSQLTVAGTIESANGGFKFPDGTIQSTAATSGSVWQKESNNIFYNDGNVGIGTTTPQSKLHLQEAINGSASLTNHVAIIENNATSTNNGPDVLALKISALSPDERTNFITFFDGNDAAVGTIEGTGDGITL